MGAEAPRTTRFNLILEKLQAVQFISIEYIKQERSRLRVIKLLQDPERLSALMQ
jgi:hypothetical protein